MDSYVLLKISTTRKWLKSGNIAKLYYSLASLRYAANLSVDGMPLRPWTNADNLITHIRCTGA